MPETAQWPLGTVIVDDVGRTTRHQVTRGNGRNRNINSKVSARFIISPFDVPISGDLLWSGGSCQGQWNYAVGDQEYFSTVLNEQFQDVVVKQDAFGSAATRITRKVNIPTGNGGYPPSAS